MHSAPDPLCTATISVTSTNVGKAGTLMRLFRQFRQAIEARRRRLAENSVSTDAELIVNDFFSFMQYIVDGIGL